MNIDDLPIYDSINDVPSGVWKPKPHRKLGLWLARKVAGWPDPLGRMADRLFEWSAYYDMTGVPMFFGVRKQVEE